MCYDILKLIRSVNVMGVFNKAIPVYKLDNGNKVQYISEPAPEPVNIDDIFDPLFN